MMADGRNRGLPRGEFVFKNCENKKFLKKKVSKKNEKQDKDDNISLFRFTKSHAQLYKN